MRTISKRSHCRFGPQQKEAEGKLNQKSQAACQMFDLCANERSPVQEESSDFSVTGSKVKPSIVHLKRNANKWRPGGGTIAAPSNQRSQVLETAWAR